MTGHRPHIGKSYTIKIGKDGKPKMVKKVTFRKGIAARKAANNVRRFVRGKPLI